MSPSEPGLVHLTVRAADSAAEVFIVDGKFQLVARGVGTVEARVRPGIYKAKMRVGDQTAEEHVVLRPGTDEVVKELGPMAFLSSAPLADTARTHEYHMQAAADESRRTHAGPGSGSSIFVFARDWTWPRERATRPPVAEPARGLSLRDPLGRSVVDLANVAQVGATSLDPWAACNARVDPGLYLLSLETAAGTRLEQSIVAVPGWQTQVFLLQRNYDQAGEDWRADLPAGSIQMAAGAGFDPARPTARLADMARVGLADDRKVVAGEIRAMLAGKLDDPMLGIYGGHLLLLEPEPDLDLLAIVVGNLRQLIGPPHPDVEALALALGADRTSQVFDLPPMLRRSWGLVVKASADRPDLVPRGSLAYDVGERLWGEEPWLIWTRTGEATVAADLSFSPGPPQANMYQAALENIVRVEQTATEAEAVTFGPPEEGPIHRYVQALGLPRSRVEELLEGIQAQAEPEQRGADG